MNTEITYPAILTSLIGLAVVGGVVAGSQTPPLPTDTDAMGAKPAVVVPATPAPTAVPTGESMLRSRSEVVGGPETGYPYAGTVFSDFVATSYKQAPAAADRPEFFAWMQKSYVDSDVRFKGMEKVNDLGQVLAAIKERYAAASDNDAKTLLEKQTGAFCHKLIKKTIKHFSLDHGFEFYSVVDHGQRQCFLQSILIAGMMQRAGMHAGVAMVTRSDKGEDSNNGHAVTLVKLSNGNDLLVDDSHKTPFIKQQGLMVADSTGEHYRYVAPRYAADGDQINAYASMGDANSTIPTAEVSPLGISFLHSQFDYYRGERTPGGFFAKAKTTAGLTDSERFFTRAINEDPGNPLPMYALGRVQLRLGAKDAARQQFVQAYQLYSHYGYVPQGEEEALGLVNAVPTQPDVLSMR